VTDPLFDVGDGNTPIDDDEADGLLLSWVRTRGDLNVAERDNILDARRAIRSTTLDDVLDDLWLRQLHQRMFGRVWSWAGRYRSTEKTIGIDPANISSAVRTLTEDCRFWVGSEASKSVVARFHHQLVSIHPFPNGNGRHARAAADYLAGALSMPPPSWGATSGLNDRELRRRYIDALRAADRNGDDLTALIQFVTG
jgi:Fic-DOC domain mobile mystery protein B